MIADPSAHQGKSTDPMSAFYIVSGCARCNFTVGVQNPEQLDPRIGLQVSDADIDATGKTEILAIVKHRQERGGGQISGRSRQDFCEADILLARPTADHPNGVILRPVVTNNHAQTWMLRGMQAVQTSLDDILGLKCQNDYTDHGNINTIEKSPKFQSRQRLARMTRVSLNFADARWFVI